jgi:hypothetical protein
MVAALIAPIVSGCPQPCEGVGCEEEFSGGLVHVLRGSELSLEGESSPLNAWASVEGSLVQGPDWGLAIAPEALFLGNPTESLVRYIPLQDGGVHTPDEAAGELWGETLEDGFGAALAIANGVDGPDLLVGAPFRDLTSTSRDDGAVYLFQGMGDGLSQQSNAADGFTLRVTGDGTGGRLGEVIATCGDVDGDGLQDWAAAAPEDSAGGSLAGSVVMLLSSQLGDLESEILAPSLATRWVGSGIGARTGTALACEHDLDGDGYADLLIGAPLADGDHEAEGTVYLIQGGPEPTGGPVFSAALLRLEGLSREGWMGWSIATGHLDGDEVVDIAVGAPGEEEAAGMVMIWSIDSLLDGTRTRPRFRLYGEHTGDGFGRSVTMADLDGDDLDDLLVGAPKRNPSPTEEASAYDSGSLYLFLGQEELDWLPVRLSEEADAVLVEAQQYLRTGEQVHTGDVDGDGREDLALLQRYQPD